MIFTLPIYYTYGVRKPKTVLVGMNFYRNAVFHLQNNVKQEFTEHLHNQFKGIGPIIGQYRIQYTVYYKNPSSDGSNIVALSEKFFLDALQSYGLVREDNVQHHLGSTWYVGGCDKLDPRVEITIQEA